MGIDYAFKSNVLKSGLCKQVNKLDKQRYKNAIEGIITDYDLDSRYFDLVLEYGSKAVEEAQKINHSTYERVKRLKNRVKTMLLNGSCIFVTLTFTDDVLRDTTDKQRRVAVSRYLKSYQAMYLANIDFGGKNNREHYHALINCDRLNFEGWRKYGAIDFERVRLRDIENDHVKISRYISKLSNHAIKETTKRSVLIYSR